MSQENINKQAVVALIINELKEVLNQAISAVNEA